MPSLPDILAQCVVAILTFLLGWILPTPARLTRSLLSMSAEGEEKKKE